MCISPSKASDNIIYCAETVISGLACELAPSVTSPAPPSDIGGDVRGCLSGSPGLNSALFTSPASDEEEDDGVLLLLLLLNIIFFSLFCPRPSDHNCPPSDANKHTDPISVGRWTLPLHRQLHPTVCFSLSWWLFLFLASVPSVKR